MALRRPQELPVPAGMDARAQRMLALATRCRTIVELALVDTALTIMLTTHEPFPAVVLAAHEAGVPIYAGTDAGGVLPHGLIAAEVLELATYGMTAEEALGAASWRARAWLGFPGLVEGGLADLVVYDADPRADLRVVRAPRRIVLRGAVIR